MVFNEMASDNWNWKWLLGAYSWELLFVISVSQMRFVDLEYDLFEVPGSKSIGNHDKTLMDCMIAVLQVFKGMEGNYIHMYSPPNPDDGFFSFAGLLRRARRLHTQSHVWRGGHWTHWSRRGGQRFGFWWKGPPTELEAGPAGDSTEGNSRLDLFNSIYSFDIWL